MTEARRHVTIRSGKIMSKAIPVLYYHRVNHVDQRMAVRPELFLRQMQHLRKKGWRALKVALRIHECIAKNLPRPEAL